MSSAPTATNATVITDSYSSSSGGLDKPKCIQKRLSRAVCRGVASQRLNDKYCVHEIAILDKDEMPAVAKDAVEYGGVDAVDSTWAPVDKFHDKHDEAWASDDVTGTPLASSLVAAARAEEIKYFKSMGAYKQVPRARCFEVTGRKPVAVRGIDINKGYSISPNYRSRLVAEEYKDCARPDMFAATPPAEGLEMLLSVLANSKGRKKLIYADVSRAYFYAKSIRPVFVEVPEENRNKEDGHVVGELQLSMHGARDAARNLAEESSQAGFIRGIAKPCLFRHNTREVSLLVHGDDFVALRRQGPCRGQEHPPTPVQDKDRSVVTKRRRAARSPET